MSNFYNPQQRDLSISRRPNNRRNDDWIRNLLLRAKVGRVSSLWQSEDGRTWPFITPLAFIYRPEQHDIIYHTNLVGRLRTNTEQGHPTAFETSEIGQFLPSNSPLELTVQYRSVMAFGTSQLIKDQDEARQALTSLSERIFEQLTVGQQMRPISAEDLARTSVYCLAIEHWSGKENWAEQALQDDSWPALESLAGVNNC